MFHFFRKVIAESPIMYLRRNKCSSNMWCVINLLWNHATRIEIAIQSFCEAKFFDESLKKAKITFSTKEEVINQKQMPFVPSKNVHNISMPERQEFREFMRNKPK